MVNKENLGSFEEILLTLVAALNEDAYGAYIANELESRLRKKINLSAVHITLYRLEDKGLIKSKMGGSTNERGGRKKRIYSVTNSGMALLKDLKETRIGLWSMIPQLKI